MAYTKRLPRNIMMKKITIIDQISLKLKNLSQGKNNKIINKIEATIDSKIGLNEGLYIRNLFDNGRQNYVRLKERYKHSEMKEVIISDWYDYLLLLNEVIKDKRNLDPKVSELYLNTPKINEKLICINEINKRFMELLGNDFILSEIE